MVQDFNGRTVVITAAGQGIGRAAAERFVSLGARVIATDINEQALSTLKGAETRVLNVLDGDGVKDFAADIGHADVLFNCAGFVHSGTILDCEEKDWDFSFDLNAKAMYRTCRAFLPGMLEKGKGAIVNMSSVASSVKGVPNRFAYTASKAAVVGLTKAIAADFVKQGLRCNALCPGTVDTPSLRGRIAAAADPVQAEKDFIARQPMGRLATTDDITPMVVFLLSDESRFVSGQACLVDGGVTI